MGVTATWLRGLSDTGGDTLSASAFSDAIQRDRRRMLLAATAGALLGAAAVPALYACVPLGRCVSGVWVSSFAAVIAASAYAMAAREPRLLA